MHTKSPPTLFICDIMKPQLNASFVVADLRTEHSQQITWENGALCCAGPFA